MKEVKLIDGSSNSNNWSQITPVIDEVAILDIDQTVIFIQEGVDSDGLPQFKLNINLLDALLNKGIINIYFLTDMVLRYIEVKGREELFKELEGLYPQFEILGVITPSDYVWNISSEDLLYFAEVSQNIKEDNSNLENELRTVLNDPKCENVRKAFFEPAWSEGVDLGNSYRVARGTLESSGYQTDIADKSANARLVLKYITKLRKYSDIKGVLASVLLEKNPKLKKIICIDDNPLCVKATQEANSRNKKRIPITTILVPDVDKKELTTLQYEVLMDSSNDNLQSIGDFVDKEIERIDPHRVIAGFFHAARKTKTIESYNSEKNRYDLKYLEGLFNKASNEFSFFRKKVTQTLYESFSDPESAYLAREVLEKVIRLMTLKDPEKWNDIKNAEGGYTKNKNFFTDTFVTYTIESEAYKGWVPYEASVVIELYMKAKDYDGITWQKAISETKLILDKMYSPSIENTHRSQAVFNQALEVIQREFCDSLLAPKYRKLDFKEILNFNNGSITSSRWFRKNDISKDLDGLSISLAGVLKNIEENNDEYRADLVHYISYTLFKISQKVPNTKRNGSTLYRSLICKIAMLENDYTFQDSGENNIIFEKIHSQVEKHMRAEIKWYEKIAHKFDPKSVVNNLQTPQPTPQ